MGRFEEARACHKRALSIDRATRRPTTISVSFWSNKAASTWQRNISWPDGPKSAQSAVSSRPGRAALRKLRLSEAAPHYQEALACAAAQGAEAHHGLGRVLMEEGRLDEAEAAFRKALRLSPALARSWTAIARLQAERGDFELSSESARKALAIRPELAEAYWRLTGNLKGRLADSEERSLEQLIHEPHLPADSLAHLYFSLATVRDRHGRYAEAAALFDKAHATQSAWRTSRGETYDADNQSRFTDGMIAAFPCGSFDHARHSVRPRRPPGVRRRSAPLGNDAPRAGPRFSSGRLGPGELPLLHQVFRGLPQVIGRPQATPAEALANLSQSAAEVMARQYTDRLAAWHPRRSRVVDKMHDNIRFLGLIGRILPAG